MSIDGDIGVIVVGVDGSDASLDALTWAAAQARLTACRLRAVTTWDLPVSYGWSAGYPEGYDPEQGATDLLHHAVEETLGAHEGLSVETVVREGHPAPVLIEEAADARLLVVGSRGHGAFAGMLLGSVSEHCASHSPCPVVIVRRPPED